MQVLSEVKQPTSPSTCNSIVTPNSAKDLVQTITKLLETGQESAHQLKIIVDNQRLGFKVEDDVHHVIDHHSTVTLTAFETCLSMLKSYDFDHQEEKIINNKRKIDRINDAQCSDHDHDHDLSSKSDEISDAKVSKERRGCYKRRRFGQSCTVEATRLVDDGYAWRKYGQKEILNSKYPRNYFRCTHKLSQGCPAIKQVQQISEDPTKYNITYYGQHTCENLHKTSSIIIDNNPQLENSSFMLNFDSNTYQTPRHAPYPPLFPTSTSLNMVNHDHDHDHHSSGVHKKYSLSSSTSDLTSTGLPSSSSDLTSTGLPSTPVSSDQSDVISPPEIYSSASTPYEMGEDLLSIINMDQYPSLDGFFNTAFSI